MRKRGRTTLGVDKELYAHALQLGISPTELLERALIAEIARLEAEREKQRRDEATLAAVNDARSGTDFREVNDIYEYALKKHGQQLSQLPDNEAKSWLNSYVDTAGTISPRNYKP